MEKYVDVDLAVLVGMLRPKDYHWQTLTGLPPEAELERAELGPSRLRLHFDREVPEPSFTAIETFSPGAMEIVQERRRQITDEDYDAAHDDRHTKGELALAAIAYAAPRPVYVRAERAGGDRVFTFTDPWPWHASNDRRGGRVTRLQQLVKAGALIAAEIDRIRRQQAQPPA